MPTFRKFTDITELEAELKRTDHVWYQAPMDVNPMLVEVTEYTISNRDYRRSRAKLYTRVTKSFTVTLTEHFERFRVREIGLVP